MPDSTEKSNAAISDGVYECKGFVNDLHMTAISTSSAFATTSCMLARRVEFLTRCAGESFSTVAVQISVTNPYLKATCSHFLT